MSAATEIPGVADSTTPARAAFAITPADGSDLGFKTRGIYSGSGGTIVCTLLDMKDGTSVTFSNVPAGVILPLRVKRVYSTNTTATGLVGLF